MFRWQQMSSPDRIKWIQYFACLLFGAWILIKGIAPGWTTPHSDFSNYYVSSRLVLEGTNLDSLYNNEWFQTQMAAAGVDTPGKFAPFPPITAWVMVPLAWLPPLSSQRVLLIFNLFSIGAAVYGWKKVTGWQWLPSAVIVLASGTSLANNLAFGQLYLIMTAFLLLAIFLIRHEHSLLAGLIIGTFTVIKYYPLVLIVGLGALHFTQSSHRSYLLTLVFSLLTIAILVALQFAYFGSYVMNEYVNTALLPHLGGDLRGQGMYSFLFQSWDSLGRNLFVYDPVHNTVPWIEWPAGRTFLKLAISLSVVVATIVVMLVNKSSLHRFNIFLSMPALAALVVLPASATYHFILLLVPLSLLMIGVTKLQPVHWLLLALYTVIGFIPYTWFFQAAGYAGVLFAYPRLGLVTLLFIVVSWSLLRKTALVSGQ